MKNPADSPAWARSSGRLNLDALADLELGEPAHVEQLGHVFFSAEGGEHAREVTDGGDGGAEPLADVLAGGGAAEVLVAASAGGLGDNLQLPAFRDELDDWLARLASGERRFASIGSAGAELGEGCLEAAEVLLAGGGDDVDAAGDLVGALDDAREGAHDDVRDPMAVERGQQSPRVEARRRLRHGPAPARS